MASNERAPQKPSTRGTARKSGGAKPLSTNTTQDESIRDTQYPDSNFFATEDDYEASSPRFPASAVRRNQPITGRSSRDMSTEGRRAVPNPNIPARSTQRQNFGAVPQSGQARAGRPVTTSYDASPKKPAHRNIHWLFYVGIGMLVALGLWAVGSLALNWGTNEYNNFVYGNPRTYQTDAVVGHNDSAQHPSHFIAINLHGEIVIYELPGGDPSKTKTYTVTPVMVAPGADQVPVTLTFKDANRDGKIDMIVNIAGSQYIFYNNGTTFVPSTGADPTPTPTS